MKLLQKVLLGVVLLSASVIAGFAFVSYTAKERRSTTYDYVLEVLETKNSTYSTFIKQVNKDLNGSFEQKVNNEYIDQVCSIKHAETTPEDNNSGKLYNEMDLMFRFSRVQANLRLLNQSLDNIAKDESNLRDPSLVKIAKLTDNDTIKMFSAIIYAIATHNC